MQNIAILGHGRMARSAAISNIEKFTGDIEGGFRFVIPISEKQSKVALWVAEWAQAHNHPFNVFLDTEELDERQDSVVQSAVREEVVDDAYMATINSLDSSSVLLIAWDDEDNSSEVLAERALIRNAKVYDLLDMSELMSDEEDDEDEMPSGDEFPTVYVEADPVENVFYETERLQKAINRVIEAASAEIAGIVRQHMTEFGESLIAGVIGETVQQ